MDSSEKERSINPYYERLERILAGKKTYQMSGGYREMLGIARMPDGKIVVEFLRPDNTHSVYFISKEGVVSEKKQFSFMGSDSKEEKVEPDMTLEEVLGRFNV